MTDTRNVSLPDELAEFIDDNHISLSKFVQDKLREKKQAMNK